MKIKENIHRLFHHHHEEKTTVKQPTSAAKPTSGMAKEINAINEKLTEVQKLEQSIVSLIPKNRGMR